MPGDTSTAPAAESERPAFTRLQLMRYSLSRTGAVQLDENICFEAQINPAEFSHSVGIQYSKTKAQGSRGEEPKFSGMDEERVSFSIVLDGTGVVPPVNKQPLDVKSQLAQLTKVVYEYLDIKSEPPYVRVLWGTLIFFGRLESLRSQYTLFKPSGDPLRAKVEMSFVGAMSKEERSRVTSRISTSTRNVTVIEGDSLGALCEDVYGDSSGFMKVARYNGLTDFRNIPPGTVLKFPPREQLGK
jgi:nucleoid-associated protein YgaU